MIAIRTLSRDEYDRVREIDVTESGDIIYRWHDGAFVEAEERWERQPWSLRRCEEIATEWRATADRGGIVLGAFDGDLLVAEAVLLPHLTNTTAQLQFLHVSRAYRTQGIAHRLVKEICRLAREAGARELYVSATPSRSAAGFYQSFGFTPTAAPHPDLFALEPEDIHMTLPL